MFIQMDHLKSSSIISLRSFRNVRFEPSKVHTVDGSEIGANSPVEGNGSLSTTIKTRCLYIPGGCFRCHFSLHFFVSKKKHPESFRRHGMDLPKWTFAFDRKEDKTYCNPEVLTGLPLKKEASKKPILSFWGVSVIFCRG